MNSRSRKFTKMQKPNNKKHQNYYLIIIIASLVNILTSSDQAVAASATQAQSKHFVLVHGSGHGAWCWFKLMAMLQSSGHRVTALDSEGSGIDPIEPKNIQSFSDYWRPLRELMEGLSVSDGKVIMVGHSYGGLAISEAMEMFPNKISVAVFVASAFMPAPAINFSLYNAEYLKTQVPLMDSKFTYDDGPNNPPTTLLFGPLYLSSVMYQLTPTQDFVLATTLIRPQRIFSDQDMSKVLTLSTEKYGSVTRVFIRSYGDKSISKDFLRWMLEQNPPDELRVIIGSDHMVMLSNPVELWGHLEAIAMKYTKL